MFDQKWQEIKLICNYRLYHVLVYYYGECISVITKYKPVLRFLNKRLFLKMHF